MSLHVHVHVHVYMYLPRREAAEKAKVGVKKINGRPVQVIFSNKRPLKQARKRNGENRGGAEEGEKLDQKRADLHME